MSPSSLDNGRRSPRKLGRADAASPAVAAMSPSSLDNGRRSPRKLGRAVVARLLGRKDFRRRALLGRKLQP
jgi:hypothetical protein